MERSLIKGRRDFDFENGLMVVYRKISLKRGYVARAVAACPTRFPKQSERG